MTTTRRKLSILVLLIAAGGVIGGLSASAVGASSRTSGGHHHEHDQQAVLQASLAPSSPGDPMVFGVSPGGVPWSLERGNVVLGMRDARHSTHMRARGEIHTLRVDVDGLVLKSTGSNPVPDLAASVFCNGMLVATTNPVRFSSHGDAHIRANVTVPALCPAPAVLLNPATGTALTSV